MGKNKIDQKTIPINPDNCKKKWVEKICDNCEFNNHTMVGHPGGSRFHSVKKHYCEIGYWEEDF